MSVIVPVYNGAEYLERTIVSASHQTFENMDIIVVDDGSTDATPEILKALSAKISNLRVITIPNGGVANARNVGTQNSTADYVAYLDADDLWHPSKIAKQVAALEQHGSDDSWAACYTLYRSINKQDVVSGAATPHVARGAIFPSHLVINHVGNGSSLLVRRDVALEVGGFDPTYAQNGIGGCEDRDFQLRVLSKYKMEVVREYLVGYRTYPGNMSSNRYAMSYGNMAVICKFAEDERISKAIKSRANAAACAYAFMQLLRGKLLRNAFEVFAKGFLHHPSSFSASIAIQSKYIVRKVIRRVAKKIGIIPTVTQPKGRTFDSYDPVENFPQASPRNLSLWTSLEGDDLEFMTQLR